ncbi:S8 family serine peptidase [Hymenobacter sp. RP-2-7]|uniref:S8 family serine peptidase n=1 Tax=Hymenobacter polaris TaxID=2682546 RepID=A0A7Y0ADG2_9BACT|nr:T9SS type A sorting domain-containing protein [Hymenobacter polaris]NML65271.1 S8 family serine peptidase [Hymenobacter polaris]
MRKPLLCVGTLLAWAGLVAGTSTVSFAQDAKYSGAKFKAATELRELADSKAANRPKTTTRTTKSAEPEKIDLLQIQDGYVVIDAAATSADGHQLLQQLQQLGLKQGSVYGRVVSGLFPIDKVGQLERVETLRFATPAYQPMHNVGLVTSQGDASLMADKARATYGVSGAGSKVGVISDSYGSIAGGPAAGVASGDLPADVQVLADITGGTDEGRAMAEIVHDVAPGAQIAFHTANLGQAGFASGIGKLADAGCNIVVDDVIYFAEPMFQDGIIAQAVDQVVARNVPYFSAAGNQARQSYQATFKNSGKEILAADGSSYGVAHDFGGGDITQSVRIPAGGTLRLSFQWAQPFYTVSGGTGAQTDLDLLVLVNGVVRTSLSSLRDNIGGDPFEFISISFSTATTVELAIVKYAGPDPGLMKYVNFGSSTAVPTEYVTNSSTVFGHANATSAVAVAASPWYNTPVFNTNITRPVVESFSSQGGTPVFITTAGVNTGYDDSKIRRKPVVTGPDGGNNTFFGSDTSLDPDAYPNFFGTSAAAPHVAAVAALMQEAARNRLTPVDVTNLLTATAQDMDDPFTPEFDTGFDFRTGYGFVQADKAVLVAGSPQTTWTGAVSTDWFTAQNWTAGVPNASLDATIPSGAPRYPVLTAGMPTTRALTINSGASLTQSGGTLDVRGNLTNNGTFAPTGGAVALGTAAASDGPNIFGSSTTRFWDLTVNTAGVRLGTSAGASVRRVLTLTGSLATQGNTFTLESSSQGDALVVNSGGEVVGAATVQRYIDPSLNPGLGYRHYSSPVRNSTVADLATKGFQPVVNAAYNSSPTPDQVMPFPTVFGYDQARVVLSNSLYNFDKGFFSPATTSAPLVPGRGYDVNISASELVDFTGTLTNGDLSVKLDRNAADTPNSDDAGWQLMGNPYPAPLDYSRVAPADRAGLEEAIYVYSSTSQYDGQYRAYINGVGGNPIIPVGQGFFARVATPGTSSTFVFRNSQRLTSPDATSFQRSAADARALVQLELGTPAGAADTFYAYAEAGATPAFDDAFDAAKLPNPKGLNLASLAGSQRLAIDGRAAFTAATTIPLAVSVPKAGTYSLSAAALRNLPAGLTAYLHDGQTGQTVPLAAGTRYTFSVAASQVAAPLADRFTLRFSPLAAVASLSATEVGVYPNPAHERFTVQVPAVAAASSVQAELLNSLGQTVGRQSAAQSATGTTLTLETAGLAAGVYVLRLQAGSSTLTKRVVVQ